MPEIAPPGNEAASSDLHLEFVAMMFALAIAEVGQEAAVYASHMKATGASYPCCAAFSHLLLSVIVIAASWVGWNRSKFHGSKRHGKLEVFSLDFIELLLDVTLVVVYFLLVKDVETPDKTGTILPSALWDGIYISAIFLLYVAWDYVSKFGLLSQNKWRIGASWVCFFFGLGITAVTLCRDVETVGSVISTDIALISLVILFRSLKAEKHSWRITLSCAVVMIVAMFLSLCVN